MVRLFVLLALLSSSAHADGERYLLPVPLTVVLGENNSLWQPRFIVRNESTSTVSLFPVGGCGGDACQDLQSVLLLPGESGEPLMKGADDIGFPAIQIFEIDDASASITMQLSVQDVPSAGPRGVPTELPVIAERCAIQGPTSLLRVPIEPGSRTSLRILTFDSSSAHEFRIRYIDAATGDMLSERAERTSVYRGPDARYVPGSIFLPHIEENMPQSQFVRIEVMPAEDVTYWAFTTTTTAIRPQQVYVVSPISASKRCR